MKTTGAALETHAAGEVTTLATFWKVTRTDNQVFGFTDHNQDVTIDGVVYSAATGYTPTAVVSTADLAVDNLEVSGFLDAASITEEDLIAGLWDFATVEIFRANYSSPSDGQLKLRRGRLGEVRHGAQSFTAELRGLAQFLQQTIGEVYTPGCRADFGDARCGVTLGTYTVSGTVTSVTDRANFADSARSEANDWFGGGLLTWTSGANSGLRIEVKSYTQSGGVFQLVLPMTQAIAVGDGYSVYAGCRKRLSDCRDKFSNVVNFRGEPYVPGTDRLFSGA